MTAETPGQSGFNPYAAPKSQVDDQPVAGDAGPAFFPVSPLKLAVMSLVTLNIYQIYWFYKNWKCAKELTGEKLNAPIRAVFYPLTSYFLFKKIREHADKVHAGVSIQAGLLALAVLMLATLWRLPDPYWLVTYLGFLPLLPVQSAVNEINRKVAPDADTNNRFRGWNIAGLVIGGPLLVLAIVGALLQQ
jgi:hypothetical protein